jgi:nucleoside-diphosphate-sugar epimerase
LPPSVHGEGDRAFVPLLIGIARKHGVSAHVADGQNRWPAVHRLDAARLFRLALEQGPAGSIFHGVGDDGVPTREIAAAIGRRLNVAVVSKPHAEALAHFGWIGGFFGLDAPASSQRTREQLGWTPEHPSLLADLDGDYYFSPRATTKLA